MSDKKDFTHWGRNTYISNCYWYHEYQDMQATVPTCEYYGKYGHCPCDTECEHFISRKEVSEMVRNLKGDTKADRPSGEWKYLHGSIGSYMTMSCPFCGETFNDVAEWKYNYCPNCGTRMKGGEDE